MGKKFNYSKLAARLAGPHELPPDPEGQNDERAEWAHRAILAFEGATGTDREDALADLLCDLMHWANVYGQDFERELSRATDSYSEETQAEPEEETKEITITPLGLVKLVEIAGGEI